jgi:hypothetical protein
MKRLFETALAAMVLLAPIRAFAFMSVGAYVAEQDADTRALNKIYLSGIMQGLQTYNAIQVADKQRVIFCIPATLAVTEDQADEILSRWEEPQRGQSVDKLPIGLGLIYALSEAFPCKIGS